MKHHHTHLLPQTKAPSLLCLALACAATFSATAQYAPPPSPQPFPGFVNEWLRKDDPYKAAWDIGGSLRLRYEVKDNGGSVFGLPAVPTATPPIAAAPSGADFRENLGTTKGADNDNSYFLSKLRLRVGYTAEWFNLFVEARQSTSTGDDRNPNVESDGPIDLHQAYAVIGNHKEFPLSLKVGRQELSYGEERIVGAFAWNNIGRVFDAAKVRWQNQYFAADFFSGRVIIPDDNNFNMSNDYDWFSGIYASTKLIPKQTTELYFLSRNTAAGSSSFTGATAPAALNGPSARDIYTIGLRVKSNPAEFGHWDYSAELAGQFGHFNDPLGTIKSQEHEAFAAIIQGGYTWTDCSMLPRVGLEYSYASGDSNPADGKHETFENLFPTNHKFYGYMDFVSLQNIHDIRLSYTMKPMSRLSTAVEYHAFWLADTHDSFYNVGGARRGTLTSNAGTGTGYGINPSYGSYVGSEIDFIAGYALTKYATLEVGYGHFFVGNYIKDSFKAPTHGSTDADYVYLQTTFTF
jgi:hypothetical protein